MAQDLIRQLQVNHEVLLSKISNLESKFAEKVQNPVLVCEAKLSNSRDSNQAQIEVERQRLKAENQSLRNEIQKLTKRLTEMELQIMESKNVLSMDSLGKIVQPNKQSSADISIQMPVTATKPKEKGKQQKQKKQQSEQTELETTKPKYSKAKSGGDSSSKSSESTEVGRPIDVSRLDFRVGKIIDVKKHPDADSLYVEQIECGEEKPRTVVSGLVKFVPLEEMQNRMVVILCNLKPAKMRGIVSEAMVMCASTPEKVEILSPPEGAIPGDRVTFEKYPGEPDQQMNPKKKIWEQIAPDLSTNENLEATYKGDLFIVQGKGYVKSSTLKNVPVK